MITAIENKVNIRWRVNGFESYGFGEDDNLYNLKTSRQKRKSYNCRCLGYWIDRKFISLTKLRTLLYIPKEENLPF